MRRLLLSLFVLLSFAQLSWGQADPLNSAYLPTIDTTCTDYPSNVWVSGPLEKIHQDIDSPPSCPGTDANKWITINGTQNEIVDFQVHIHDTGSGTTGYSVTVSSFVQTAPASFTIAAPDATHRDVVVYLEDYMNITTSPTALPHAGTPPALNIILPGGLSKVPDILVPTIDPYYHQTTNAMPMNIAANQNQSVWVDVHIPTTAPAGYYKGTVTLSKGCTGTYPGTGCTVITTVPIIIGVWQWPNAGFMPSTATLRSIHVSGDSTCQGFYGASSGCQNTSATTGQVFADGQTMFLDHRLALAEQLPFSPTGSTWTSTMTPLLNGTANTILPSAKINTYQWSTDGGSQQFWATTFQTGGWLPTLYVYGQDEPPPWTAINPLAVTLHGLSPPLPQLVTTSFFTMTPSVEQTACGSTTCLDNSIDIMVSNVAHMFGGPGVTSGGNQYANIPEYITWRAGTTNIGTPPAIGRQWWSYSACDSMGCGCCNTTNNSYYFETPSYQIDATPIANRIFSWFDAFSGQTGDLYYQDTICWTSNCGSGGLNGDPWIFNRSPNGDGWGDGNTAYPGRQVGTGTGFPNVGVTTPIWLPSLRLKEIRDGMQDYEYMTILNAKGKSSVVSSALAGVLVTTSGPSGSGIGAWSFNNTLAPATGSVSTLTSDLPDARNTLGAAMHALTFGTPGCSLARGIIDPARCVDWTQAGIPGGLPDGAWTQCGATQVPGVTSAQLRTLWTSCTAGQYVLLGPGTFNLTPPLNLSNQNQVVLRGSGASQTHLVFTGAAASSGCSGFNDVIQIFAADCSNQVSGSGWPNFTTVTGPVAAGATTLTVGSTTGITNAGNSPSLLFLSVCDTGYTGFPCAPVGGGVQGGGNVDNGNFFVCAQFFYQPWSASFVYATGLAPYATSGGNLYQYINATQSSGNPVTDTTHWTNLGASPNPAGGCDINGPIDTPKGNWINRYQYEIALASSTSGTTINLLHPIQHPNMTAAATPMLGRVQGIYQVGIENLSIDTTAVTNTHFNNIEIQSCYQCFVSGIAETFIETRGINVQWSSHTLIQNSYFFNAPFADDPYGIRFHTSGDNLVQNNIFQKIHSFIVKDGADHGTVIADNFCTNDNEPSNSLWNSFWSHAAGDDFGLEEGNECPSDRRDWFHGDHMMNSTFRNFFTGWLSRPATPKTSETVPIQLDPMTRYENDIANITGTPSYHTAYNTCSFLSIFFNGCQDNTGSLVLIPGGDPLVNSTGMKWANWDSFHAATQCNTSEVPSGISPYPNPVPTLGCSGGSLPASFYQNSKPSWWVVSGQAAIPYPAIGPDITGGNIGQCTGTLNTTGQFSGLPGTNVSQCTGSGIDFSKWAGHVNANPAMLAYLTLGGNLDGTSAALNFDANIYGVGIPSATLTPALLAFGNQNINTTSNGLAATLTNTGTLAVTVTAVTVTGNFSNAGTGTCVGTSFTLAVGASCTFVITFSPTATTAYTGTLSVTDNANGSPQVINLSGQGTAPVITWSSPQGGTTYNYGNVLIGSPTTSGSLTLKNTGTGPLSLSNTGLSITGTNAAQFTIFSSSCPDPLIAGASCQVIVTFTPAAASSYTALLTETDVVQSLTGSLTLNGTGVTSVPVTAPWTPIMQ